MKYHYDPEQDALLITFRDGDYADSEEIYPGFVIDFDSEGRPIGLDIYQDASRFIDLSTILPAVEPGRPKRAVVRDRPHRKR